MTVGLRALLNKNPLAVCSKTVSCEWFGVSPLLSQNVGESSCCGSFSAPDIRQDTKGAEYFCCKAQREQSMALRKFLSAFWDIFLPHDAVRLIINFLLINPFFSHA
ncbi:mCG148097 [Mus musculus]|nr:mCG148097 [Mus musculus]